MESIIAAIAGALIGFIGSQLIEVYRQSKESKTRQKERLVDMRIEAHEKIMMLAQDMIAMRPVNVQQEDEGNFPRGPWVLESFDSFKKFYMNFINVHSSSNTWAWVITKRELNYCQDYFLSLYNLLSRNPDMNYDQLSFDIRQDFIDMAEKLRKTSMNFLTKEMPKLKYKDINEWHKLPKEETVKRLTKSLLGKKYLNES